MIGSDSHKNKYFVQKCGEKGMKPFTLPMKLFYL